MRADQPNTHRSCRVVPVGFNQNTLCSCYDSIYSGLGCTLNSPTYKCAIDEVCTSVVAPTSLQELQALQICTRAPLQRAISLDRACFFLDSPLLIGSSSDADSTFPSLRYRPCKDFRGSDNGHLQRSCDRFHLHRTGLCDDSGRRSCSVDIVGISDLWDKVGRSVPGCRKS